MQVFLNQKEVNKVLKDVETIASNLFLKGWSEKNAGNISVKLTEVEIDKDFGETVILNKPLRALRNTCFYATSKGSRMQDIAKSAINNGVFIVFNETGTSYKILDFVEGQILPTSELPTHLAIHNLIATRGSDETAVLHTHATELITLTHKPDINKTELLNKIIWGMHPEAIMFIPKGVGFIDFLMPGTPEIAEATLKAFKEHDIVLWDRHGVFAIGNNITEAFDSIDIVCKSAGIYLSCLSAGFQPKGFSNDQLKQLKISGENYNSTF